MGKPGRKIPMCGQTLITPVELRHFGDLKGVIRCPRRRTSRQGCPPKTYQGCPPKTYMVRQSPPTSQNSVSPRLIITGQTCRASPQPRLWSGVQCQIRAKKDVLPPPQYRAAQFSESRPYRLDTVTRPTCHNLVKSRHISLLVIRTKSGGV